MAGGDQIVEDPAIRAVRDAVEAVASGLVRREGGEERPLGAKAARTRARILRAARDVFAERGYQASAVGTITERAEVGAGTFYQYFRDRSDVLAALVGEGVLLALADIRRWDATEGRAGLRTILHAFVSGYAANADFQAVWEEVSHVEPALADLRQSLTAVYVASFETELERAAARGLVRPTLDPVETARALTAMVDRYCFQVFVQHAGPPDVAAATDLLTDLWAGAIGLE
jgi:AcrR family transcriptional regulator